MNRLLKACFFLIAILVPVFRSGAQKGVNDTILLGGIQVDNQVYPMLFIDEVEITSTFTDPKRREEIRRLRYNVYKVYPYAVTAAFVLNKVDKEVAVRTKRKDRKQYLKTVEKEMSSRFKDELKNLSMTQGQILVKLINRQTGRDCYSVIKEIKGGLNARIYQTAAFFFDNDLKAQYDPYGKDKDIEMIVQEIESKNYYQYQYLLQQKRLANAP
ncbi:DUF4294 domain-containing protein [Taibaiella koreensis]|uniref:DUF4294 domain-containing protein n=1 Tax=Taibaiella koreensis TaxID=1268548 RepID=UPI000E59A620|nr:DUF4294 domain-containing protein [Taibaiella koreensis]